MKGKRGRTGTSPRRGALPGAPLCSAAAKPRCGSGFTRQLRGTGGAAGQGAQAAAGSARLSSARLGPAGPCRPAPAEGESAVSPGACFCYTGGI